MASLRSIGLVAQFDLFESLRSRKAIALILIYVVISLAGSALFIQGLNRLRARIEDRLGADVATEVLESEQTVDAIAELVDDDKDFARSIVTTPPLALFNGWLALTFIPLVVMLTSTDAVSNELVTGSARYALFRVDRLSWALGKLAGQALLMIVGIAVGTLASYLLGAAMLDGFKAADTAWWMARLAGRAAIYGFAYLGVALCASMLVKSNGGARGIGIGMLFLLWMFGSILGAEVVVKIAPTFINAVHGLFPNAYWTDLWRPAIRDRLFAMAALLVIGAVYFGLGYLRLSRRDA
jgi:ABC-type transport system involved in multi-copper enzyme maturation permease subunit